jgi:hypothetical protein
MVKPAGRRASRRYAAVPCEIVDGDRSSRRATSRTPQPPARRIAISSRSANDRCRPDGPASETVAMPPPSRNHRTPTGPDTPASAAAVSLEAPRSHHLPRLLAMLQPSDRRTPRRPHNRPTRSLPSLHLPAHRTPHRRGVATTARIRPALLRHCAGRQERPGARRPAYRSRARHDTLTLDVDTQLAADGHRQAREPRVKRQHGAEAQLHGEDPPRTRDDRAGVPRQS